MLVPAKENWWESKTMPFSALEGGKPAHFKLRQVDDNEFRLLEPFKYVPREGKEIPVTAELLGDTDLASIPSFLGWFARRHGRHTPAALMHDELITTKPQELPPGLRMSPTEAALLFRQALRASEVPLVMSWVLWTGVTLLTRWRSRFPARLAIIAWFAIAVAGTTLLVYGVQAGRAHRRVRLLDRGLRIGPGLARLPRIPSRRSGGSPARRAAWEAVATAGTTRASALAVVRGALRRRCGHCPSTIPCACSEEFVVN